MTMPARPPLPDFSPPVGWPLLPVPDDNGALQWPDLAGSVAQHLRVLLATRPGELLMTPDYGAGLQNWLYQPNTLATRARMRERIEEMVGRYEPRVSVDRIEVWDLSEVEERGIATDPAERGAEVRVEVHYRLRRTGEAGRVSAVLGGAAGG